MKEKTGQHSYFRLIILVLLIFQCSRIFSNSYQNKYNEYYEKDDIEVIKILRKGTFELSKVKRITDNTFPAHITIDGVSYPITNTYRYVKWPEDRPDTLIIPEGIITIGLGFTGSNRHNSRYRNLRYVKFPSTLKTIGRNAFHLNDFRDILIPSSIVDIRPEAFRWCNIENLDLGRVQFIGARAFMDCGNLKWVNIPKETRMIGREAFNRYYSENYRLFFLQLSSVDINPVIDFLNIFGSVDIPYVACASEFLNPGIKATYQSDMPDVFENRAMIHLDASPVPLYFSFEETGCKEALWEDGIDLWAYADKATADADGSSTLAHPVRLRLDISSMPPDRHAKLRVLYNDREITDSIENGSFLIDSGRIFNGVDYKSGTEPIYNRLKVILE